VAKAKNAYVCGECGADHAKWQGQCASCGAWNTLREFRVGGSAPRASVGFAAAAPELKVLAEVSTEDAARLTSGISELDRVLGGGLVSGSVVLIGGEPGAGKSTLLLQVTAALGERVKALYVTGEESLSQVAMRARRLSLPLERLGVAAETNVEAIRTLVERERPEVLVVDSIQVMHCDDVDAVPGTVTQVRESAAALTRLAKTSGVTVLLVGHVTKEGGLAGPKVLEHMIDCFMMLESSDNERFRTLRGHKNRFGAANELGVFAMTDKGLKEVANPSAIFLNRGEAPAAGSVVTVLWEGTRCLLVEIQALVDATQGSYVRRVAVGLDGQRLSMLLAVLHRHGGIFTGDQDVYANVVGGVKVTETGADLAVALAALSSLRSHALPRDLIVFGELGLSGEVRPVANGQERLRELSKHGFRRAIVPRGNRPRERLDGVEVVAVATLGEALNALDRW
jgi:DNA repair protein RadA/Sms